MDGPTFSFALEKRALESGRCTMDALDYACDIKEVPQLRRLVTAGEQTGFRNPQFTIELPPFVTNIPHEERPKVRPSGQDPTLSAT